MEIEQAILRRREVERITGLSRWTIYRLIDRGEFPAPTRLGRRMLIWKRADVQAWVDAIGQKAAA